MPEHGIPSDPQHLSCENSPTVAEHRQRNWCCVDWACKRHSCAVVSAESAGAVKHDAHRVSFPCHETPDYDCWDACNTSEIRVRVVGNTGPRSHSPSVTKVAKNGGHGRLLASRLGRGDKLKPKSCSIEGCRLLARGG